MSNDTRIGIDVAKAVFDRDLEPTGRNEDIPLYW